MKRAILTVLALILLQTSYAVVFNEIMYDPDQCPDTACEWVEIYNNETTTVNISSWTINNKNFDDIVILPNEYVIVARKLLDLTGKSSFESYWGNNDSAWNLNDSAYRAVDGDFTLANSGGNIVLKDENGKARDNVTYLSSNKPGYSLEKTNPTTGIWKVSLIKNGTPGTQNTVYGADKIDYSKIKITEFLPNPAGNDSAQMPEGEWIELFNPTSTPINAKWMFFRDLAGHELYVVDTTVKNGITTIPANGYLVIYTNGKEGLLNNLGPETISLFNQEGNLIQNITYVDSKEGNSYSYIDGIGWQNTKPSPGVANTYDPEQNESSIKIENILDLGSDKKAKFGQTIRVKINVYKGDTTKNAVDLWIEDKKKITKDTSISFYTKYTNYVLTIPLQIKPNCNNEFEEGSYDVHMEGFGMHVQEPVQVEGSTDEVCDIIEVETAENTKFNYNFQNYPETVYPGKEFTTIVEIKSDDKEHELEVWSYVYRGSKSYSGDKESNKQKIRLSKKSSIIVELKNTVVDANPGDYKLKVKIRKDNQKTLKELTGELKIEEFHEEPLPITENLTRPTPIFTTKSFAVSTIVFESTQKKAEKLVPYAIIAVTSLTAILMIFFNKGLL